MARKYKRLSFEERVKIQTLLEEGRKRSYIANKLHRDRSTIKRELDKWIRVPSDKYDAGLAHFDAVSDNKTKRKDRKINLYPILKIYVFRGLLKGWSPEQIANRIKLDYPSNPIMRISYEAIYQYIYEYPQGKLNKKLINLLVRHKSRRRKIIKGSKRKGKIKDTISIDNRPMVINQRIRLGDFEGDLIIGKGQKSAIATLVDRKSRYTLIIKVINRKSRTVINAIYNAILQLPMEKRKSMTYDNGTEMAEHKLFTQLTGMKVYFAHPYSSWERGTNENTNGLIRRYFPKKTDFTNITQEQLNIVQDLLNNRPRKVLGYKTPKQVFFEIA
jgi:IS30 family transposase